MTGDAVRIRGLSKFYGATQALQKVDLTLGEQGLHALVGENGSGKSTLMRIVAGWDKPDAGIVEVSGTMMRGGDLRRAHQLGVSLLGQQCSLAPQLSVLENFALAAHTGQVVDRRSLAKEAQEAMSAFGVSVPVVAAVASLDPGVARCVELARLMWSGKKVYLLDEPTANLGVERAKAMFKILRNLGATVLFSTHKVDEALGMSDKVHVLRKGSHVISRKSAGMGETQLLRAMFGKLPATRVTAPSAGAMSADAVPALVLRGLDCGRLGPVELRIMPGEAVGVTGLAGGGMDDLASSLLEGAKAKSEGILVRGRVRGSMTLRQWGLAVLPGDCSRHLGVSDMCVDENLVLHSHADPAFRRWATGLLDWRAINRHGDDVVASERLSVADGGFLFGWLSGGNQRKMLLARELGNAPAVLVAHDIDAGLDHRSATELVARLADLKAKGMAMVVISEDTLFLERLADRMFLVSENRLKAMALSVQVGEGGVPVT